MRSSAGEAPIAPRAKQTTPSGNSGTTACPAGGQPISQSNKTSHSPTHRNSIGSVRNHKGIQRTTVQVKSLNSKHSPVKLSTVSKTSSPQIKTAASGKHYNSESKGKPQTNHTESLRTPNHSSNFGEYDDQEWDVGVGDIIVNLDADIAQTDRGKLNNPASGSQNQLSMSASSEDKVGLKMKIKRTKPPTKTSEAKHVIVKSDSSPTVEKSPEPATQQNGITLKCNDALRTPNSSRNYKKEKKRIDVNGSQNSQTKPSVNGPLSPLKESKTNNSSSNTPFRKEQQPDHTSSSVPSSPRPPNAIPVPPTQSVQPPPVDNQEQNSNEQKPGTSMPVKQVEEIQAKNVAVGTDEVGTMTEPDCLGPCDPGTNVKLEGVVWNETNSVLVVNVTWRGKSYVGSLLDCSVHDWAPNRICDSPASDMDNRIVKGRGKRGRTPAAIAMGACLPDNNLTETRSGKLRNTGKGRRGGGNAAANNTAPSSPITTKNEPNNLKRKSKEEPTDVKAKRVCLSQKPGDSSTIEENAAADSQAKESPSPCSSSSTPKMIECPEPNCCKKYSHINGLRYHQNHAHKENDEMDMKDSCKDESPSPVPVGDCISESVNNKNVIKASEVRVNLKSIDSPSHKTQSPQSPRSPKIAESPSIQSNTKSDSDKMETGQNDQLSNSSYSIPSTINRHDLSVISQASDLSSSRDEEILPVNRSEAINLTPTKNGVDSIIKINSNLPNSPIKTDIDRNECNILPNVPIHLRPDGDIPHGEIVEPSSVQGTQLSSLPGNVENENERKLEREETHSPAYSDISDANDSAPNIGSDLEGKDFKDDKKFDVLPSNSPYSYNSIYYPNPYVNHPQYLMSVPPNTSTFKPEIIDIKDRKEGAPAPNNPEFSKMSSFMYPYSPLYPGYPSPYLRDPYREGDKEKMEGKIDDAEKGPTDLSRSANFSSELNEKPIKDVKIEASIPIKEHDLKAINVEKRHDYRYGGPFEGRMPLLSSPHEKSFKSSTPGPLASPRSLSPSIKEDKDKRQEVSFKCEGVKPTMETTGPPPPPTSSAYFPSYPYPPHSFDPYRSHMMSTLGLSTGFPSAAYIPGHLRFPMGISSGPEDLSRSSSSMIIPSSVYNNAHKLTELQERSQKSPLQSSIINMSKNSSPLGYPKEMHHGIHSSSPSLQISSSVPTSSIPPSGPISERKMSHPGLPDSYSYPPHLLAQFSPHHLSSLPPLPGSGLNITSLPHGPPPPK